MIEKLADFRISLHQFYAAIYMASCMMILESFVHTLSWNGWVVVLGLLIVSLIGIRYQVGIMDTEYLHDMIPHHSMAVLTSRAILKKTNNVEVYTVAKQILDTQSSEIQQMKMLTAY